jgi:hypothetical protein
VIVHILSRRRLPVQDVRLYGARQEILFARFTEADVKAGKLVSEGAILKQLINRLSDSVGGVHKTREPQLLEEAFLK